MLTIYKYPLQVDAAWAETLVDLPRSSRCLSVGEQDGIVYLWATVDTSDKDIESRRIFSAWTGWDLLRNPVFMSHIGTVQRSNGLVVHIFEGK